MTCTQLTLILIIKYYMNTKILKPHNPNKKKLIIVKNTKENLEEVPENSHKKDCFHLVKQRSDDCERKLLPPLNSCNHSRISISLPPEGSRIKRQYSLTSSSKLSSISKLKLSSFFGNKKASNLKIDQIINAFIKDFLKREIFSLHFGKYLIQPKNMSEILLFVIDCFNNSKNLATFQKTLQNIDNYEQMLRLMSRNEYSFKFGVRSQRRLSVTPQTMNIKVQNQYRINLEKEGQILAARQQQLLKDLSQKRNEKQLLEKCISQQQEQVSILNSQLRRLSLQISKENETVYNLKSVIMQNQQICDRVEANRRRFSTFMVNFNENRYHEVATTTRRLQDDLVQYAEYLNFHPLGRRTFEKSKYTSDTEKILGQQFQQFCKYLTGQCSPLEGKIKLMREFLLKVKSQYSGIVNQLLIVIQEKTEFISKFTKIVTKWHQNYRSRKTVLAELTRTLSFQALNLEEIKTQLDHSRRHPTLQCELKAIAIADKILAIYQTAESFI